MWRSELRLPSLAVYHEAVRSKSQEASNLHYEIYHSGILVRLKLS